MDILALKCNYFEADTVYTWRQNPTLSGTNTRPDKKSTFFNDLLVKVGNKNVRIFKTNRVTNLTSLTKVFRTLFSTTLVIT